MNAVEAVDVSKVYRLKGVEVDALHHVTLAIAAGEMVSLMGPSGSGKTTLLNCLSGLDEPTTGTIRIDGALLEGMSDKARARYRADRMGFIFQSFNLLPVLTAHENVELPLRIAGVGSRDASRRASDMLSRVDMERWSAHKPAELSGGQQQRVAIARALVNTPAIVWADEPTGNLDSENAHTVMELLKKFNVENDQTLVIVTHDPTIGAQADRIIEMKDGAITSEGHAQPGNNVSE
ncbi:MAG: ABC transporter ATP-binding protein [Halobacteriota archaeon]